MVNKPIPPIWTRIITITCPKVVSVSLISQVDNPVVDRADADINKASQKVYFLSRECPCQSYFQ
jgi:hypothetical protein